MSKQWICAFALGCVWVLGVGRAFAADVSPESEYGRRIKSYQTIEPTGDTPFGEQVNLYTGDLTFQNADVVVPGMGPTISLTRTTVTLMSDTQISTPYPFGDWTLSVPRIETLSDTNYGWITETGAGQRCSEFDRSFYATQMDKGWYGVDFVTESGERQGLIKRGPLNTNAPTMLNGSGQPIAFPLVTQQNWQIGCLTSATLISTGAAAGEGFFAVSPNGTKYWFDKLNYAGANNITEQDGGVIIRQRRRLATMNVSRIEDRFGNSLTYRYNTNGTLKEIEASDGRFVSLTWRTDNANLVDKITVQPADPNKRVWQYQYVNITAASARLTGVVLPDGSMWTYDLQGIGAGGLQNMGLNKCNFHSASNPDGSGSPSGLVSTVTHPSGAVGKFWITPTFHARNYVPSACMYPPPPTEGDPWEDNPPLFATNSLTHKEVSGPGLATQAWNYTYQSAIGSTTEDACASAGTCSTTKWVNVIDASGNLTSYVYSNQWGETEGKLLRKDRYQGVSGTPLRTELYTYAASTQGPWPATLGYGLDDVRSNTAKGVTWTPMVSKTIVQQGKQFIWLASSFDVYSNPVRVTRSSDIDAQSTRTDDTTYYHDLSKWVIGQAQQSKNIDTNIVESETVYDAATALPAMTFAYTKLQRTFTYGTGGVIATVSDARDTSNFDTTISFGIWKRGIPQLITFPGGVTKSAVVDDLGLIRSVTDETNAKTCYDFDLMGRLTKITYPKEGNPTPVCNTDDWNATLVIFTKMGVAEYGIPPGHWRQEISTGNGFKRVYMDAYWRPLVEESYDNGNINGTLSQSVKRYDNSGQFAFASYPMRGLADFATVVQGTRSTYDALGRPTRVEQDTELGVLASTREYLSGFITRSTNPRGNQTTTSYRAFDAPATDFPIQILMPENAVTEITRDRFGKPTMLTRRDAGSSISESRYYVYDQFQRLCKQIEPETNTTVMGYDEAGNVSWSAAGLALPDTAATSCDPDRTTAMSSSRVVNRAYDTRGRLTTLLFPDQQGNQTWTYTADSLPAQVTTLNDGTSTVNAYNYNSRRMLAGQGETTQQVGWYTWGFGSGYDRNGSLVTHVYPGGETINYAPNALGQPTQVVSPYANYATGVSYFPNGALQQFTYGNGIVHTLVQNARQLPDRSKDAYSGTSVLDDSYTYDANGNVAAISDGISGARGNRTMGYDGLDRLTSTVSPMFGTASYSYDVLDNLTHVAIGGTKSRDQYYCFDTNWRLTNIKTGGCTGGASVVGLGYDVQGNLQNKNGRAFNFDYGNRLRSISDSGTYVEVYRYDGHGRRVLQWNPAGNILSMYGQDGVLRYQENGRIGKLTNYVYLSGGLVATHDQATATGVHTVQYQHTDALGSPVAMTDAARNVVERSEYEPYGQLLNRPIKDGPGFTGHVADALSGLTYMQQRYYDPQLGTFLSVDPVAADTSSGANFNRYIYANKNPYMFVDPDGRVVVVASDDAAGTAEFLAQAKTFSQLPTISINKDGTMSTEQCGISGAAKALTDAIDSSASFTISLTQNNSDVTGDQYITGTYDVGDFQAAEGVSEQWASALFTHVLTEYRTAAEAGGNSMSNFPAAHEAGLAAESAVMGAYTRTESDARSGSGGMDFNYQNEAGFIIDSYEVPFK